MVKLCKERGSILVFDAAYAPFIRSDNVPKSIFEIEGAKDVAIECVVADGCLEAEGPLIKVRLGSAGPQATQMIYCILRIDPRSKSANPAILCARKFPRRQAAAVVVGAHRVTHGALAPKAKL